MLTVGLLSIVVLARIIPRWRIVNIPVSSPVQRLRVKFRLKISGMNTISVDDSDYPDEVVRPDDWMMETFDINPDPIST
jgi:hypothetical protein